MAATDGLHDTSGVPADDILDRQARAAYRQRLADLDRAVRTGTRCSYSPPGRPG